MSGEGTVGIYCLEVGQGDSHLIVRERRGVLIDGGPPEIANALLRFLNDVVDHLDVVILTHNDRDHSGGLSRVLTEWGEERRISSFWGLLDRPPVPGKDKYSLNTLRIAISLEEKGKLKLFRLERAPDSPMVIPTNLGELQLSIFHPKPIHNLRALGISPNLEGPSANATSGALRLSRGNQGIALWLADLPVREAEQVAQEHNVSAKFFVVPHHGSGHGWSVDQVDRLLNQVNPLFVGISVGTKNSHNHPASEWLKRATQSSTVLCTQITSQCHPKPEKLHQVLVRYRPFEPPTGVPCAGTIVFCVDSMGRLTLKFPKGKPNAVHVLKQHCVHRS